MNLLDDLEALHEAATPGPWRIEWDDADGVGTTLVTGCEGPGKDGERRANMILLAAARNALPLLIRLVLAQEALIAVQREAAGPWRFEAAARDEYEAARRACEEAP